MSNLQAPSRKVCIVKPYSITHRFKVAKEFVGSTLLEMMTIRFPFRDQAEWALRIGEDKVGVNERSCTPDYLLKEKDQVFHYNPSVIEPSVPDEVEILYQTENYLIVFKPAPMPMHPGGRYNKNTLTEILKEEGYRDLKIVHRLDGVTSGIVLFAKTKEFAKKAMECFRSGRVTKTYYAHVSGIPQEDKKTIEASIRRKRGFVFESEKKLENGKNAITRFSVLERRENSAIIKCEPVTGRTHQIRLHLENWGYPVIDDPIYGSEGDRSSKKTQNVGIRLLSAGMVSKELGVCYTLDIPADWEDSILKNPSNPLKKPQ